VSRGIAVIALALLAVVVGLTLVVLIPRSSDSPARPTPILIATQTIPSAGTTYEPNGVETSLEKHGFDVDVIFDRTRGDEPSGTVLALLALFDDLEDVDALVADAAADGAIGREVSAWIFDSADHVESFQSGSMIRPQKRNVVTLTDAEHQAAVRAALDDLG
jgi:hypothetical protein